MSKAQLLGKVYQGQGMVRSVGMFDLSDNPMAVPNAVADKMRPLLGNKEGVVNPFGFAWYLSVK